MTFYNILYTQVAFVFHLPRDFYIAYTHIVTFCFSLLQKELDTFHEIF